MEKDMKGRTRTATRIFSSAIVGVLHSHMKLSAATGRVLMFNLQYYCKTAMKIDVSEILKSV